MESELNTLTYNGSDPVVWAAKIRGLITKLTAKQAAPTERTVRTLVLKALEQEVEYRIRVEVIRHSQPDITLMELWAVIGRFPYPVNQQESLLAAFHKHTLTSNKSKDNKQEDKGSNYVPKPRPRKVFQQSNAEQTQKDKEQGNCYKCHVKEHVAYHCPKYENTDIKGKIGGISSEDEKQKGKSKTQPSSYAFFAQEVQIEKKGN